MITVLSNKKNVFFAFFIFTLFVIMSASTSAEEIESTPVPIHLNLKESAKFSPETSGDLERVAIEEKHSSYETSSPFTRNKGDWKNMGTWESDSVKYDTQISNIMFNLWWVEDTNEEDYNAALDLQWTVYEMELKFINLQMKMKTENVFIFICKLINFSSIYIYSCLLYTSDAADE